MQGGAYWVWGRIYSEEQVLHVIHQIQQQGCGGPSLVAWLLPARNTPVVAVSLQRDGCVYSSSSSDSALGYI